MSDWASALSWGRDESALVSQLQAGSEAAFDCLVTHYHAPVFNLILSMLADPSDAADGTQEVTKAWNQHASNRLSRDAWRRNIRKLEAHPVNYDYRVVKKQARLLIRAVFLSMLFLCLARMLAGFQLPNRELWAADAGSSARQAATRCSVT